MKIKDQGTNPRKGLLLFISAGCGCIILFLAITFFSLRWSVTSTEAYQDAMRRVRTNTVLLEELGAPISAGWRISSSRGWQGAARILDFSLTISGPKKSGTLTCRARLHYREWDFDLLEAKIGGKNDSIDLRIRR